MPTDVITFEEYTGQAEGALTNNHSPSLNSVKHPSGIYSQTSISLHFSIQCGTQVRHHLYTH